MPRGLILEGVTGTGKSQILELLRHDPRFSATLGSGRIFPEDETFGDLMEELRDASRTDIDRCVRLRRILQTLAAAQIEHGANHGFLLERFHPSYFALMPQWRLYHNVDAALARMDCRLVLLQVPSDAIVERALAQRPGDTDDRSQGLIAYYGSAENAAKALRVSQERRLLMAKQSGLLRLTVDTGPMDWPSYAGKIMDFWAESN